MRLDDAVQAALVATRDQDTPVGELDVTGAEQVVARGVHPRGGVGGGGPDARGGGGVLVGSEEHTAELPCRRHLHACPPRRSSDLRAHEWVRQSNRCVWTMPFRLPSLPPATRTRPSASWM